MIRNYGNRVCVNSLGSIDTSNPICAIRAFDFISYFLLGLESSDYQALMKSYPNLSFGSIDLALLRSVGIDKEISLRRSKERFMTLFTEAKEQFEVEKKLALGQDLTLIFDEAVKRNYHVTNPVTAQSSIEALITFLNASQQRREPDVQHSLREQVLTSLQEILNQVIKVANHETTPDLAKDAIFAAAELKIGTSFLGDRLERLIRTDLERLVYDSDKIDDTTRLPLLAAGDAITELRRFYQVSSLQEMQESASNAQLIMNKTIDPFIRLFSSPMQRAFDEFDSIARKVGGDGAAQALALKTKMCFYFLGSIRPQDFFLKECEGLVAKSVLGLQTPPFRKDLYKDPLQGRACLYRNFIMKNRIKERQTQAAKYPGFHKLLNGLNRAL